jgi:competence protein ComEC
MGEVQVVAMAAAAWIGAARPIPLHPAPTLVALALAVALRRPWLTILLVGVLASGLSARAEAQYRPAPARLLSGEVAQLVTDPVSTGFGERVEVKSAVTGERLRLFATGAQASTIRSIVAGDVVAIWGRQRPLESEPWFKARHLVGSIAVDRVEHLRGPAWYLRPSGWLRAGVSAGAASLSGEDRALYLGLVIGDDRDQGPAQRARFRAAGLTHLLAVSGQNVAFALAVVAPLTSRAPPGRRFVLTLVVLAVFAVATRLEPSVLRATATAGVTALAVVRGRRASGIRALGLAVTALTLVDPFLTDSVGFQLSVAASGGILVLGPALAQRLPGPGPVRMAAAVTIAAQLGVSPILIAMFGPVSVVTLPANLLAGWAAGAVMTLGLSVGLLAAVVPSEVAAVVQLPTVALVWWIDQVAVWSVRVPAPRLGGLAVFALVAVFLCRWILAARWPTAAIVSLVPVLLLGVTVVPAPPTVASPLDGGGWWYPGDVHSPSVLVVAAEADARLVDALVEHRIVSVDLVVLERGSRPTATLMRSIGNLVAIGTTLAPPRHRVVGATRTLQVIEIVAGDGRVLTIVPDGDRLSITADLEP